MAPIELLEETIGHVVARLNSLDLHQIIRELPGNTEEAAEAFCDRFELGTWFWEALTLNDADIGSILSRLAEQKMEEEAEDGEERGWRERELQTN